MEEQSTETSVESRPVWEGLEAFARKGCRRCCTAFSRKRSRLGRQRYARREGVDATIGYRNGYGKPRRLSLQIGDCAPPAGNPHEESQVESSQVETTCALHGSWSILRDLKAAGRPRERGGKLPGLTSRNFWEQGVARVARRAVWTP